MRTQPLRRALDFGERPDPQLGIFETILVTGGAAPLLAEQLERLRSSATALYGATVSAEELTAAAVLPGQGRLRVTFVPGHDLRTETGARPPDPQYTAIAPFVLPGGLGPHKWADRALLDALAAEAGPGALPILLDEDLSLLEATYMNVLIEERGRLISPPADGRFREGFGRRRLRYDEEPVDLDRLLAADALLVTSALRVLRLPLAGRG